jgi:hypothetical protein
MQILNKLKAASGLPAVGDGVVTHTLLLVNKITAEMSTGFELGWDGLRIVYPHTAATQDPA